MLASIKWAELGELLYVAPIAVLLVTVAYALVIVGTARAGDARREGASGLAFAFSTMAVLGFAVFMAAMVFGISIITTK